MAKEKRKELENPFVYKGYEGPNYFCDREKETQEMVSALQNGRNLTVISPRKIGKTGLIKHIFNRIKAENKDAVCVYIDIFFYSPKFHYLFQHSRMLTQITI